jgi:enoyl-CoA hydratase
MAGLLSIEREGAVEIVTLQRPDKRNALSIDLRLELADTFTRLASDSEVGCIVLTGAGSAFCSGMDTTQFGGDADNRRRLVETSGAAFDAVALCPTPVIAAVNGPALAGGFALALLCDLRISSTEARFGFPELPAGIPPSYAAARAALTPAVARYLCLSGAVVDARRSVALGISLETCSPDQLLDRAKQLAQEISAMPREATSETKRRILLDGELSWRALWADEGEVFRRTLLGEQPDPAA